MTDKPNNESSEPVDAIFQMLLHTLRELWVIKDRVCNQPPTTSYG